MKPVNYLMLMICMMILSCKLDDHQKQSQLIIGDWTFVKEELKYKTKLDPIESLPIKMGLKSGYTFDESGTCEDKLGYFKHKSSDYTQFLGIQTKYRVRDNRLGIFDLAHKVWKEYEILKLDNNILRLVINDSVNVIYEKSNYKLAPEVPFDQIIVSSSGCYGTCPINDVMIFRSGEVILNNEQYTKNKGLFSSHIDSKEFENAEKKFRKANLKMLKDRYAADWTDDNEITISLIQNGKIYKTISDYGNQSPAELYWAYLPVTFFDQKLNLKSLSKNSNAYVQRIFSFEKGDKLIRLAKSEGFYLANLLSKANCVNKVFVEKYILKAYGDQRLIRITTDGQYYKMKLKDDRYLTVDLGYDFLQRNDLLERLSAKQYYEK
jgi:hypothetical protein